MQPKYYDHVRSEIFPHLPDGSNLRVLELGCGEGHTGAHLKSTGFASEVVGVELFEDAAESARGRLDEVFQGDLDSFSLPEDTAPFDVFLCLDVIEHLKDPWAVLDRLSPFLSRGGYLVTSTPNVRYWRVLYDLAVRGRWEYEDMGIMDRTHLRWFTRRSIAAFHEGLGMRVENIGSAELSGKRASLDRLTGGRARDFLIGQHVVRSVK